MSASGWYYKLKTASGSRTSLILPKQVKTRSGVYLGQTPARVRFTRRVNRTISMKRGKNNVCTVLDTGAGRVGRLNSTCRSQVLRLRARLLRCWRCYSGAEESTKIVLAEDYRGPQSRATIPFSSMSEFSLLQIDVEVEEPETSENPTESFETILWINECVGFSDFSGPYTSIWSCSSIWTSESQSQSFFPQFLLQHGRESIHGSPLRFFLMQICICHGRRFVSV